MKLDALSLDATITEISPGKKLTVYEYLWCNENAVEESGLGPTTIIVEGTCKSAADRDALEQKCQASGVKKLYFSSALGQSDDRYFKVQTHPVKCKPRTASLYEYTIECVAADPTIYSAGDDQPVWNV